jgi:hypothetical protein
MHWICCVIGTAAGVMPLSQQVMMWWLNEVESGFSELLLCRQVIHSKAAVGITFSDDF